MTPLQQAIQDLAKGPQWIQPPFLPDMMAYLATGDSAHLAKIRKAQPWHNGGYYYFTRALTTEGELKEEERRVLRVLAANPGGGGIREWLNSILNTETADQDQHAVFRAVLSADPVTADLALPLTTRHVQVFAREGRVNSAGRYLLGLSDDELRHGLHESAPNINLALLAFLVGHAAERIPAILPEMLRGEDEVHNGAEIAAVLLKQLGTRYESEAAAYLDRLQSPSRRFPLARALFEVDPVKYRATVKQAAQASLAGPRDTNHHTGVGQWLMIHFGTEALPDIAAYARKADHNWWAMHLITEAVQRFGREALPVLEAGAESDDPDRVLHSLGLMLPLNTDGSRDAYIHDKLEPILKKGRADQVIKAIGLLARCPRGPLTEYLWGMVGHASRPVRAAVARALAALGAEAVERAGPLLKDRKKDIRQTGVDILRAANTPAAVALLEARLDEEADETVRDSILLALESVWVASGRKVTLADVEARMARIKAKLEKPPVSWLDEARLPVLHFQTGEPVPLETMRYLLFRQSRCRELRPDIEARPLFDLIDRSSSGDFALAVLQGYLDTRFYDAAERWALTLTALLGDERAVTMLSPLIRQWAEGTRGKLAEFAVQALALQGSDAALLTIDALANRYRLKKKNVGVAANEAFRLAAERRGVTTDELGDRVVPWLGFEPGKPRVIDCAGRQIRVRIGLDFKLKFDDLEKNKAVASLPKSAPAEVQAEMKAAAATLREVVKAQLARLENLLVRQQRWAVATWRDLFLSHPVLFPFAVRLVWGSYGPDEKLRATFRALEDRSLTDAADEFVSLPEDGTIGMIHPLELLDEQRAAWQTHLADYEIEPPFAQMERPVVRLASDQGTVKVYSELNGTKVNALSFRGRAERLAWVRSGSGDGGSIRAYWKNFPASRIAVLIEVEGLYFGVGVNDQVTAGNVYFLRSDRTSPSFHEPRGVEDPRVLAFSEVSPVVYSEVIGEVGKIAGKVVGVGLESVS